MKPKFLKTHLWIAAVGALVLLLGLPGQTWAQGGAQSGSLNATEISTLFTLVLVIAVGVFVLVEGLLIFAIVRYRRRRADEMPRQVHGNTALEIGWTVGSFAIVLVLFFFTLAFYQTSRAAPADDEPLIVEVIGHTWYWEFRYPTTGVSVSFDPAATPPQPGFRPPAVLRVPAGQTVVLEITSQDVQHSFWVPALAGKVDAIPGRVQRMWFKVDQPGTYVGQCAEYCGFEHYNMLINVEVMAPEAYAAWMDGQAAAVAAAAQANAEAAGQVLGGDAAAGEQLYTAIGCNACHSLDGSVLVGPSFQGLGQRAGERIDGYTAEEYLHESIVAPCSFVVEGFFCVMPQNYGDRLTPQNIADLIAFLQAQ